ncbi:hypothetical protein JNUCC64_11260 [Streptomyces sp. JNUCC 64]
MTTTLGTTGGRRGRAFLRGALVAQTVALLFQTVTAGALLFSSHGHAAHDVGARVMYAAAMAYLLAAVLAWRPGGGPVRPVRYAAGFVALASAQVAVGVAYVPSVHVPLGVTMFALSLLVLVREVSGGPARRSGARP